MSTRRRIAAIAACFALLAGGRGAGALLRGDANCDGVIAGSDLRALIARIFAPRACGDGDPNLDGATSASDLSAELDLFAASPPPTATASPTPTPTSPPPVGPVIAFFRVLHADNVYDPSDLVGTDPHGVPIYRRPFGTGFMLVVEGKRSCPEGNCIPGDSSYEPEGAPSLQIQVNRALGDGSSAVCDDAPPFIGGVPAIDPPSFASSARITDALNDLGCRFVDGAGRPSGRGELDECSIIDGDFQFFDPTIPDPPGPYHAGSDLQFCTGVIPNGMRFPVGDTLVTARLLDRIGRPGPIAQIIVRVEN